MSKCWLVSWELWLCFTKNAWNKITLSSYIQTLVEKLLIAFSSYEEFYLSHSNLKVFNIIKIYVFILLPSFLSFLKIFYNLCYNSTQQKIFFRNINYFSEILVTSAAKYVCIFVDMFTLCLYCNHKKRPHQFVKLEKMFQLF